LKKADLAMIRGEPRNVIDATYDDFRKAKQGYDDQKRELFTSVNQRIARFEKSS
jgi:hypothetical protein